LRPLAASQTEGTLSVRGQSRTLPQPRLPWVGSRLFLTKGGQHVNAVQIARYEHVDPALVGSDERCSSAIWRPQQYRYEAQELGFKSDQTPVKSIWPASRISNTPMRIRSGRGLLALLIRHRLRPRNRPSRLGLSCLDAGMCPSAVGRKASRFAKRPSRCESGWQSGAYGGGRRGTVNAWTLPCARPWSTGTERGGADDYKVRIIEASAAPDAIAPPGLARRGDVESTVGRTNGARSQ
jgi:hypothetical protein